MLYQINKGTKHFGSNMVFEDIQFEIVNSEKVAIVGRNGAGKSTLLKCITGELELDRGTIHKMKEVRIGYLSQTTFDEETRTVQEEMNLVFAPILKMQDELQELAEKMTTDTSEKLLETYSNLQQRFENAHGYTLQTELLQVFTKFGFKEEDLNRPIVTFSGGQRTRLAFVKLLLSKPDILLLDEPTNHLDLETIEWLEGYLKKYEKAVILVSHDRTFLDHVAEVIYELEYTSMKRYKGNYSSFAEQKKNDTERQMKMYQIQQKEIERMEALIEKFRYKASKAAFAQSKIKALERMEKIEAPTRADDKTFKVRFTPKVAGGKTVLETRDLVIGYTPEQPLCKWNLEILRGQKVAILGPNGTGKSTFVKTIMGQIPPLSGSFLLGHQIEPGYFDQQMAQLDSNKTVLDELWDEYPDLDRTQVRKVLGQFLFTSDDVFKTVSVLSGGEKVRLSLAKLLLKRSNFLVLDEPTNHLDIVGKEALEDSLQGFEGTILFVSHDRYFISKIATMVAEIKDGEVHLYPYGYQQFNEIEQQRQKTEIQEKKQAVAVASKPRPKIVNVEREIKKIEAQIAEKEQHLEDLRALRFEPEYYHDYQKMNELNQSIDEVHNELEHLMEKWQELLEILEENDA